MGRIHAICKSDAKGTAKYPVEEAMFIENHGIEGDAHAGDWHRQISLLAYEEIETFNAKGAAVAFGAFGENIVLEGYDLKGLPVGTQLKCGHVILEVTQIGKACHKHCEIYHRMGDCIMPREGVFCRVIEGGHLSVGQMMEVRGNDEA